MSGTVRAFLRADARLGAAFGSGDEVRELSVREDDDVESLRRQVRAELRDGETFVLLVGRGEDASQTLERSDDVVGVLRTAYGLLTGAARCSGARIVVVLSSAALLPDETTSDAVLLRSLLGMAEALRAELLSAAAQLGILFHDSGEDEPTLGARVSRLACSGDMYDMSLDLTAERIEAYFAPMRAAIARAPAAPALPDIGPMAEVYVRAVEDRAFTEDGASSAPKGEKRWSR